MKRGKGKMWKIINEMGVQMKTLFNEVAYGWMGGYYGESRGDDDDDEYGDNDENGDDEVDGAHGAGIVADKQWMQWCTLIKRGWLLALGCSDYLTRSNAIN